jgi:hypothetical protein
MLIGVSGNGLQLSEDLARRFVNITFDAKMEDPESRPFKPGFLDTLLKRRSELLASLLTIWRWGRIAGFEKPDTTTMGSYEEWGAWCRDPLVALGCCDPAKQVKLVKANDPYRQQIAQIFKSWDERHGSTPILASDLCEEVVRLIDPQGRGRQFLVSRLGEMAGTRVAGFVFVRNVSPAKWTPTTYELQRTEASKRSQA